MSARYAVGIDLGTTHCAMARIELHADAAVSEVVRIPQLVAAGELDAARLLPSFMYLAPAGEGAQALPWDGERRFAVGGYARARAAEVPGRVVASSKSWLIHPSADRRAGMLPLAAQDDIEPISPVEAAFRYLEHLVEAYDQQHGAEGSLTEQRVVLTVPASFDAGARELTVEAALAAGIDDLTLLEEPQAALYAWLEQAGDDWRHALAPGDMVLVVDVGGGTSDFSAIEVRDEDGELTLSRVAVGDHILLGGDNMDLALAHHVRQRLEQDGAELDAWQMSALTHAARDAKERLLGDPSCTSAVVVVPSRGSKLVGKSLRAEVTRDALSALVLEGFFPVVGADARPAARARVGLTQVGLPYASDAAITKHLAQFLARQAPAGGANAHPPGHMLRPSRVLFNGGVMRSAFLRDRLLTTLAGWFDVAPRTLDGADLDLAVARGAACYGRTREGHGIRIRGGSARAYYVGIEAAVPAVPGMEPPITLMCVAPFGMEEGSRVILPQHQLAVVVGEPVRFRFLGSSVRRDDVAGTTHDRYATEEIIELPPIEVTLPAEGRADGDVVPVSLSASITEVGTLLLEALPREPRVDGERWKIELSVRTDARS